VLGKFPVVQHILFGSLFKCTWQTQATQPPPDGSMPAEGVFTRFPGAPDNAQGMAAVAPGGRQMSAAAMAYNQQLQERAAANSAAAAAKK
jgi:hypothetical protein